MRIRERRIFSFADTKRLFYVKNCVKIFIKILQNEHFSLIFFLVISRRGYRASYQGNFMIHIQNPFPNNLLRLFGGILNYRHIKITVRIRPINRNLINNSFSPLNNRLYEFSNLFYTVAPRVTHGFIFDELSTAGSFFAFFPRVNHNS